MPDSFERESLSHDPIHGYIPFTATGAREHGEAAEQEVIDHPWVQRLRQIHQLQSAWWVFPAAEHMRFQHALGAMHLASRAVQRLYPSLRETCPDAPSQGYIESLVRMAALLHDVGHGPYGHFFDDHYLAQFRITHEDIGAAIIVSELGALLRRLRRNPYSALDEGEQLDPAQVAYLIRRPRGEEARGQRLGARGGPGHPSSLVPGPPRWLDLLRALFSGLYTVDNMDFVLRDAYMAGYSPRAFDLDRLLHYSFFSEAGLTIHRKGLPALVKFIEVRADLFRVIYFHRTVRALDLTLAEVFGETMRFAFRGNPLERLEDYRRLTEWSLIVDVERWADSDDPQRRALGERWQAILRREVPWRMACERTLYFKPGESEQASIFSEPQVVERRVRALLPPELRGLELRVDVARHYHRPGTRGAAAGQNFLYDPATRETRELSDDELFAQLPASFSLCRIYARDHAHDAALAGALDSLIRGGGDAKTNM